MGFHLKIEMATINGKEPEALYLDRMSRRFHEKIGECKQSNGGDLFALGQSTTSG